MIGAGVTWLGGRLFYDYESLLGSTGRPSEALALSVFGSGLLLTCVGVIVTTARLDRKHRAILAIWLLSIGTISFLLAMGIAHAPMFLVLALPALLFGAIVGLMAMPQQSSSEPPRQ